MSKRVGRFQGLEFSDRFQGLGKGVQGLGIRVQGLDDTSLGSRALSKVKFSV